MMIFYKRLVIVLSLVVCLVSFCSTPVNAAEIKLQSLSAGMVTPGEYKGKQPVLFFFWTTWCPYCREEIKKLNQMNAELKKEGIIAFAIDIGEPSHKISSFFKGYVLKMPVLLDQDGAFSQQENVSGVPTYIMLNKNGREIFRDNIFPADFKTLIVK